MTYDHKLTGRQLRALLFLPADGKPVINIGKMSAACDSLRAYHSGLVVAEWGDFGPRSARKLRWFLTPKGCEVAAQKRAEVMIAEEGE